MCARRGTIALNFLSYGSSCKKKCKNTICAIHDEQEDCLWFSCARKWKEAIYERDRSFFELNMGSKRSAVTLSIFIIM